MLHMLDSFVVTITKQHLQKKKKKKEKKKVMWIYQINSTSSCTHHFGRSLLLPATLCKKHASRVLTNQTLLTTQAATVHEMSELYDLASILRQRQTAFLFSLIIYNKNQTPKYGKLSIIILNKSLHWNVTKIIWSKKKVKENTHQCYRVDKVCTIRGGGMKVWLKQFLAGKKQQQKTLWQNKILGKKKRSKTVILTF